jgi:tetratricopeptide (TPR) repeat protein
LAQKIDQLYELIHSLSPSEKGYFKKFASGESNYIKLFAAIDSQKNGYDEQLLKKKLKGEKFMKHLAVSKKYLYEQILDALAQFHAGDSVRHTLRRHLLHVEMLANKGVHAQCRPILNKALKLAEDSEAYGYIREIIYWEKYLTVFEPFKTREEHDRQLLTTELDIVEKLKINVLYEMLYRRMFHFVSNHSQIRSEGDREFVEGLMADPLLKDFENATTMAAKIYYIRTHVLFKKLVGDSEGALSFCRKMVEIIEERPESIASSPKNYLEEYLRYLIYCMNSGADEEFKKQLVRFRNTPEIFGFKIGEGETNMFFESSVLEMHFYIVKMDYEKAIEILQTIEPYLLKNESRLRTITKSNLFYQSALSFFRLGNYAESLVWLNKLLQNKDFETSTDLTFHAKILNLILHYELGNFELVDSLITGLYRFLYKKQKPYEFEKAIMQFLKKITRAASQTELQEFLKVLKMTLEELENNPFEKAAIQKFPFIPYLEKKLLGSIV